MQLIEGTALSNLCDYSFGDQMGGLDSVNLPGGFIKPANQSNAEFLIKASKFQGKTMTLFIDNIRLYNRPLWVNQGVDESWVTYLLQYNDLLKLCGDLKNNKFIIFTSHEDTPIDDKINVPENVLGIYAVNAKFNNDKIHPFPIGLQRPIGQNDRRVEIIKDIIEKDYAQIPNKLLYINCGLGEERNSKERAYLPSFEGYKWTTCRFDKNSKFFSYNRYPEFLTELKNHKFVICPEGHGMDCHRNWETLYMRRVPVMKINPYFSRLMKGFPVLFVPDWSDVTQSLLIENEHLYREAQEMSLKNLDLNIIFNLIINSYQ